MTLMFVQCVHYVMWLWVYCTVLSHSVLVLCQCSL